MNRFQKWCWRLVTAGILIHCAGACFRPVRLAGGPADTALMVTLNGTSQYIEIHGQLLLLAQAAGDTATLRLESEIPFSVESGYSGGWPDMIRHRIALVGYRINDHDTVYENRAIAQYEDYRSLDWLTPVMRDGARLYKELMEVDYTRETEFKIPVYLMAGRYDYNTSHPVVEKWFESIRAPQKEFIWFENSGHSPQWEEPTLFAERVKRICTR
jgi:pimeloyl-ACP methyl ester carboxylesterase